MLDGNTRSWYVIFREHIFVRLELHQRYLSPFDVGPVLLLEINATLKISGCQQFVDKKNNCKRWWLEVCLKLDLISMWTPQLVLEDLTHVGHIHQCAVVTWMVEAVVNEALFHALYRAYVLLQHVKQNSWLSSSISVLLHYNLTVVYSIK